METQPTGLMNNTKWREVLTVLSQHSVYLQLKLCGEPDFPMDTERSDQIISNISQRNFTFVRMEVEYREIDALRICTRPYPRDSSPEAAEELMVQLKDLGQLPLAEDDEGYLLLGYQP